MYKSKLQELCQKQKWALPVYESTRGDGPNHSPRFLASVTVNGVKFEAVDPAASIKEADNKVAQMAFERFAPTLPPPLPPAVNQQLPYKSQLQVYAQKHLTELPVYTTVHQGPAHAPIFKAQVIVGGKSVDGTLSFKTSKEAENDVAKTALMLLQKEENSTSQDNMVSYKNLLLELAQKERLGAPNYKTGSNGTSQMSLFSSIVEIGDDSFFGEVAKTKKQAEMNAAKVAWLNLKERYGANSSKAGQLPSPSVQDNLVTISSVSQSKVSDTVEISHFTTNHTRAPLDDEQDNEITTDNASTSALLLSTLKIHQDTTESNSFIDNKFATKSNIVNPASEDISSASGNKEAILKHTKFTTSSSSAHNTANAITDVVSAFPVNSANSSLLRNRVRVYPRTPDLVLDKSETELPFSDDKWVAVSVDDPNHEGDVSYQENGNAFYNNPRGISVNGCSEVIDISSPHPKNSSSSSESSVADSENSDIYSTSPVRDGTFSLLCNRIAVYPNNSDVVLPEGVSKLAFSDDKWVALSYDI